MRNFFLIFGLYFLPAYLIGSIPYGYLFSRLKGIDIRQYGSGNIGATNVWRVLGREWGLLTFILDFLKVPIAFWINQKLYGMMEIAPLEPWLESMALILLFLGGVLGHNYPVWLKFKGGKGIATSAGGLLLLMPKAFGVVWVVWILVFFLSRYVSFASVVSAATLPFATWIFYPKKIPLIFFAWFLGLMAVWRHRTNIQRLIQGTEHRWTAKKNDLKQGGAS